MFPLIIIFFLFQLQVLCAVEFPNIMPHIEMNWENSDITSKINSKGTWSIDGNVPTFIFCGPFKTSGNGGECRVNYKYSVPQSSLYETTIFGIFK